MDFFANAYGSLLLIIYIVEVLNTRAVQDAVGSPVVLVIVFHEV